MDEDSEQFMGRAFWIAEIYYNFSMRNYRCRLLHRSNNFTETANFHVIFDLATVGLILINFKLRRPARFWTLRGHRSFGSCLESVLKQLAIRTFTCF